MNFGACISAVYGLTKRADKSAETKAAINKALEVYVKAANWSADLVELTVAINPLLYAQSFIISTELPHFRKMKYIRPTGYNKYLQFIESDKIFQPDGCELVNSWYRAGDNIVFKTRNLAATLEIGYYRFYDYLVNAGDTHWMLDAMPGMIIDKAVSEIFDSLGADTEARRYLGYASQQFLTNEADMADGANRFNATYA